MDACQHLVEIKTCRVCDSEALDTILNFGYMPLANGYAKDLSGASICAPLEVVLCRACGCVQLRHTVDPEILFSNYLYTSSTSGSLSEYFRHYALDTVEKLGLSDFPTDVGMVRTPPTTQTSKTGFPHPRGDGHKRFIVGIGGNDGVLEKAYQALGFDVVNVEPSRNIAELSKANGVPTLNDWFNNEAVAEILDTHGRADLITCNHCFAHMPDINGVMRGVKALLNPGGWFVFEESYWRDMVAGNNFDQIYHEHVFYWTVRALEKLFRLHDLPIDDVEFNKSQGGSIRVFVRNTPGESRGRVDTAIAGEMMMAGLFDLATYQSWNLKIDQWRTKCNDFIYPLESICCYGVPAKFAMISEKLGFRPARIAYAVEDSQIKVGRFTPGARIPIVNRQHFIEHPTEHCIITAANYADLIVANNPQYKGRWIALTSPEPKFL